MSTSSIKSEVVRTRIDPDLKKQATEVLADLGLDMSDAIRMFLHQVVLTRNLPFTIREHANSPNAVTIAAMEEARLMSKQ